MSCENFAGNSHKTNQEMSKRGLMERAEHSTYKLLIEFVFSDLAFWSDFTKHEQVTSIHYRLEK